MNEERHLEAHNDWIMNPYTLLCEYNKRSGADLHGALDSRSMATWEEQIGVFVKVVWRDPEIISMTLVCSIRAHSLGRGKRKHTQTFRTEDYCLQVSQWLPTELSWHGTPIYKIKKQTHPATFWLNITSGNSSHWGWIEASTLSWVTS